MALSKYISANESQLWVMELEGEQAGKPVQLLPKPGSSEAKAVYFGSFLPDSRTLLVATDRFGEFRELTVLDAKTQELQRITAHIPWDISGGDVSFDGRTDQRPDEPPPAHFTGQAPGADRASTAAPRRRPRSASWAATTTSSRSWAWC
jgi:hypothetical protein